ncbi:amidohydrolase family-domain-containing protein [Dactylonectria estremocensis]|uniref:Amidohydrolase family-domain-containing protein n=1 Tax=Dactylonectria estremocensis TaxID=1079267 RepID=A0A9P9EQZ8_9HYPO|nr:amidohydrolase family-domain-containing protein [Dactylonectria estremocensis]
MIWTSQLVHLGTTLAAISPLVTALSQSDIVFHNGSIYTMNKAFSEAEAVAITNGIITYVGSDEGVKSYIGNTTKAINLNGRMAMPGLVDSHMHVLSGGLFLLKCNLNYQSLSRKEILEHIQGCIDDEKDAEDDAWLEVVNMDYPSVVTKSGSIDKFDLDELNTLRPIFVRSSGYHTVVANSRALELSEITADTESPSNGVIERVSNSHEPSGVLQDDASNLLVAPDASDEENVEAARAALKLLREEGITSFQDAAATMAHHTAFDAIKQDGGLSARAWFDYAIDAPGSLDDVSALVSDVVDALSHLHDNSTLQAKPVLKWQAVKGFIDGVITYPASTAAVIEPYWSPVNESTTIWAPDADTMNDPYWDPEILTSTLELLFLNGIDVQLHTDGDLAVRVALDAQTFHEKYPGEDFKLGLAHDELSHDDDWPRFAELGVKAIVSYQWAQLSSFYIPDTFNSLGEYRIPNLQAWAQFELNGLDLVYGSDWPIDPMDEFLALRVAVTRAGDSENSNSPASQDSTYDAVFPGGTGISRKSALQSITINGAKFLRADEQIGSLEVGKLADIIVLDGNFMEVAEEELGRQSTVLTMVGGEVVYVADGENFGVTATFSNEDEASVKMARRTIGGFAGKSLTGDAKAAVGKLRKRGDCGHKHLH